jgi:precorrin-3B synthase
METGDGFLVRLRFSRGVVIGEHCIAIGQFARRFGNGLIDLSQRGNLQLRGISANALPALTSALYEAGLLSSDLAGNVERDFITPPLAGIDPSAGFDASALIRELEMRCADAPELRNLPDKFCFLVDDGGRLGLDDVAADIRLISFDGCVLVSIASGPGLATPIALVKLYEAPEAAVALACAFLRLCGKASARRMDQLVQTIGVVEIASAAGFAVDGSLPLRPHRVTDVQDVIGVHDGFIGIAAPYGRLHANQMDVLASWAPHSLRLTPWRSVLLPGADALALKSLERAGLIVSPDDARLAIVACPGQPACGSAQIDTRLAAETLAPLARAYAPKGVTLHISGCSKGCARAAPTALTLVGRDGSFDMIFDGKADGEPVLHNMDLSHSLEAIEALNMTPAKQ